MSTQTSPSADFDLRILDQLNEGYQVISKDWKYLYVNDSVVKQAKMKDKTELIGFTVMEKFPGIENTELFKQMRESMEQRSPKVFQTKFDFPDGSEGWFEVRIGPIDSGIFLLTLDITERMQKEKTQRTYHNNAFWGKDGLRLG